MVPLFIFKGRRSLRWEISNATASCKNIARAMFLSMALVHLLKGTKTIGTIIVAVQGVIDAVLIVFPILTDIFFFDTWLYWVTSQILFC